MIGPLFLWEFTGSIFHFLIDLVALRFGVVFALCFLIYGPTGRRLLLRPFIVPVVLRAVFVVLVIAVLVVIAVIGVGRVIIIKLM